MKSLLYRLMYWLGMARWDTGRTPPEVVQAFQAGDIPPGAVIDLGCGTGTNVIYMAKQGRLAIGIDFVPEAIAKARVKAQQAGIAERTRFIKGDVTRMAEMQIPASGFALDMGCFHGLDPDGQQRYAEALAKVLVPGGWYMLYTLDPRKQAGIAFGIDPEQVQPIFAPWFDLEQMQHSTNWDNGSTWFWMRCKP